MPLRVSLLGRCCCCIDLRVGSLIIGYLNLFAQIIMVERGCTITFGSEKLFHSSNLDERLMAIPILMYSLIFLMVSISSFTFTIALLMGLHMDRKGHVKAYMMFNVVWIIVAFVLLFVNVFFFGHVNVAVIVVYTIGIVLNIYFLLVIRSYYDKMENYVPPKVIKHKAPKPKKQWKWNWVRRPGVVGLSQNHELQDWTVNQDNYGVSEAQGRCNDYNYEPSPCGMSDAPADCAVDVSSGGGNDKD